MPDINDVDGKTIFEIWVDQAQWIDENFQSQGYSVAHGLNNWMWEPGSKLNDVPYEAYCFVGVMIKFLVEEDAMAFKLRWT